MCLDGLAEKKAAVVYNTTEMYSKYKLASHIHLTQIEYMRTAGVCKQNCLAVYNTVTLISKLWTCLVDST